MLNNIERLIARVRARRGPANLTRFQTIGRKTALPGGGQATVTIDFPTDAAIVSVRASATFAAQAADHERGGLDMIRMSVELPGQNGTLTGGGTVSAAALFGKAGSEQWPEDIVIVPRQNAVLVTFENLTSSPLDVDIIFNTLQPPQG